MQVRTRLSIVSFNKYCPGLQRAPILVDRSKQYIAFLRRLSMSHFELFDYDSGIAEPCLSVNRGKRLTARDLFFGNKRFQKKILTGIDLGKPGCR